MKNTTTLFAASLLLLLSSAAVAAELADAGPAARAVSAPAAAAIAAPAPQTVEPVIGISPVRASGNCAGSGAPFFTAAWASKEESLLPNQCGDCSGICAGKTRGMQCVIPGPNGGFGNCNIYSGGERCENGGWSCQCGRGPLP